MRNHISPRIGFWTKRGLSTFAASLALLLSVELLKGHELKTAIEFALLWSAIATVVFLGTRIYHVSRGRNCPLCDDLPKKPIEPDRAGG